METSAYKEYQEFLSKNLALDITRGQPAAAQFDLSDGILDVITDSSQVKDSTTGTDLRNYGGGVAGLKEARELFAPVLDVSPDLMIVGENSSLALMGRVMMWALLKGVSSESVAWQQGDSPVKFICPVPGYDRHFTMLETLGVEMIPVDVNEAGLDVAAVRELVEKDSAIKGMWLVPKYSNPTGITLADSVVQELANLKPAASDFRIFADNAYAIHDLYESDKDTLLSMYKTFEAAGAEDMLYLFGSTSKVTYAGSGLGFMAASPQNRDHLLKLFGTQTIGPNKIEQLRHVLFFEGIDGGLEAHMKKHADIIRPKFEAVLEVLEKELGGTDLATWTKPRGGYFISFDTKPGLATRTVELAGAAGVKLTPAGATYPYRKDPKDANIRIAPTKPDIEEIRVATTILCCALKVAASE